RGADHVRSKLLLPELGQRLEPDERQVEENGSRDDKLDHREGGYAPCPTRDGASIPLVPRPPDRIVVMGVSGSGKSTVGAALAARRGTPFLEADSFHSAANVAKMAAGTPLTDGDRWPWLAALRQALRAEDRAILACSALKRSYRDAVRAAGDVRFL